MLSHSGFFVPHPRAKSIVFPQHMAESDENCHPSVAYTSSSRNSRRSSSLFQLHGGSLLDVIGATNLPFILPESLKQHHAIPSPPASDSSNDGVFRQLNTQQAPEMHEPAQGSGPDVQSSSPISNECNAADSFERWDSQPTNFPRPALVFTGAAALTRLLLHSRLTPPSRKPLRPSCSSRYFHIISSRKTSLGHHHRCNHHRTRHRLLNRGGRPSHPCNPLLKFGSNTLSNPFSGCASVCYCPPLAARRLICLIHMCHSPLQLEALQARAEVRRACRPKIRQYSALDIRCRASSTSF